MTVIEGSCEEAMRELDEASVDAIVCDPPYGLEFMGKEWDRLWRRAKNEADTGRHTPHGRASRTSPEYAAGLAAQEWHREWATEALRVLKPGGHLLAFGGTRTYHRLACAVEDAGFEIRDSLTWLYGSGFPKSLDVSKAIDKAAGAEGTYGEPKSEAHAGWIDRGRMRGDEGHDGYQRPWMKDEEAVDKNARKYEPATPEAAQWQGWGTALKPSHEPIVVARKPLVGTVAANVLEHGTGGLNVDGCRIGSDVVGWGGGGAGGNTWNEENCGLTEDGDARPVEGRWPSNCVLSHLPECVEVGVRKVAAVTGGRPGKKAKGIFGAQKGLDRPVVQYADPDGTETIPAFECAPGCPISALDAGDESPSRFFYTAKASRAERNAGLEGLNLPPESATYEWGDDKKVRVCDDCDRHFANNFEKCPRCGGPWSWKDGLGGGVKGPRGGNSHPTVKPIDLMRWLVRLVTPPGGTVLDPFTGSGTTGCAAALEGFNFIGIEREAEYAAIARARIEWWSQRSGDTAEILRAAGLAEKVEREHRERGQLGLLEEAA